MSEIDDLSWLHKVLKDQTRARILQILEKGGPMSYTVLLQESGITNTGRFNYHLKILDDLVSKGSGTGQYGLSEKGALALDFLGKFKAASSWSTGGGDPQQIKIPNTPFTRTSRMLQLTLLAEILAVLFVNLFAYFTLPSVIPLQYEFNGKVFATAPKSIFILFAVVFNISQVVFLSLSVFQYPVVRRQMNSPGYPPFRTYLSKISYEMRGYWINKYFSPILAIGAVTGLIMVVLSLSFYQSAVSSNGSPPYEIIFVTVLIVLVSVIVLVNYMRWYVKRLGKERV